MSFVTKASGGDGWTSWSVRRHGDDMTIRVFSNTENVKADTPSGWEPKTVFEATIRDYTGRNAIALALSESNRYGALMAQ